MERNFKEIEERLAKGWEDAGIFEADPIKGKPKTFITFPFPYMNGPLHIGHALTSTRCDVYARFKRMQGYNVLFPWAWHLTGEPISGAALRVKKGDREQIKIFKEMDGVPDEELEKFTDPEYIASYYIKESKQSIKQLGHSIDWRREFHTTELHPQFNKFIQWQYLTLKEKGYVKKGTHPVIWCPNCLSPTGDHDRLKGEGATPVEFTLLKFKFEDAYLPAATLRPETIFGVVNMWLNPDVDYVKLKVGSEKWIVSRQAAEKIKEQKEDVAEIETVMGKEMIGRYCTHPISKEDILILPAAFVDPDNSSGVVMSVPSHAPYDFVALKDIQKDPESVKKYNITKEMLDSIKPISLIEIDAFGEHPAIEISDRMKIKDQNDPRLEEATEIIYRAEFYKGILKENTGKYAGMKVMEVKKMLVADFEKIGVADRMYEVSEEVICRCNTRNIVKILKNQWFLKYSDEEWKDRVREALNDMIILPHDARSNFEYTIGWLDDKACARKGGLGTPLPWDREWKVETLSDSTVYMAFYTISKFVNEYKIKAENLTKEVFDFVFLGIGDISKIAENNNLDEELLKEMKAEFDYFMPVDFRNSAKELIPNHLTFYIFHHVALFKKDKWPRIIGVNGMISIEGDKMSKSKGNFVTLKNALSKYGADTTRATLLYSSEGMKDPDWRFKSAMDISKRLDAFYDLALQIIEMDGEPGTGSARDESDANQPKPPAAFSLKRQIDRWILGRLQGHIKKVTDDYENVRTRSAFQTAFFDIFKDVRWYMRRDVPQKEILNHVLDVWVRLLAPCIPFLAEDIFSKMGGNGFLSVSRWPEADESLLNEEAETGERLIEKTAEDIDSILKVTKIKPKKIVIYTSPIWKWQVLEIVRGLEKPDMKRVMERAMKNDELKSKGKEISRYVTDLLKNITKIESRKRIDEYMVLSEAVGFFSREFGCEVEIFPAGKRDIFDPLNKKNQAAPMKPAIYVE